MSLNNWFSLNMPYGLKRLEGDIWIPFNREYRLLGSTEDIYHRPKHYGAIYIRLTDDFIRSLSPDHIKTEQDRITQFWLYGDGTNPLYDPKHWSMYFDKVKRLSHLTIAADGRDFE